MDNLFSKIESIFFVASKPLSAKQIARTIKVKEGEVLQAIGDLQAKYNQKNSGIHILSEAGEFQMATNPENHEEVDLFVKDEAGGELTKAQLETLTVVAYRGPITRPELEQIRGVNCAVILRHLLIRGLIDEKEIENKILPVYSISLEALRYLAIMSPSELPDYDELRNHQFIENALEQKTMNQV